MPKFTTDGAMLNWLPVAVPVPLRGRLTGPLEALLVNVSDPDAVPLAVGLKVALNVRLCPAGMVNGKDTPVKANCEPLLASADTVTLPPVALTVKA